MQTDRRRGIARFKHQHPTPWDGAPTWALEIGWQLTWVIQALQVITAKLNLEISEMAQIDDELAKLTSDVAAERGVVDSAVTLISGFSAKLDAAVAEAKAAGATPEQLQAITDLSTAVTAQSADLGAAVAANP